MADVYFLFVGKSKGSFNDLMIDPSKDYFVNSGKDMVDFAQSIALRICESKDSSVSLFDENYIYWAL